MNRLNTIQLLTEAARNEIQNEAGTDYIHQAFYIILDDKGKFKVTQTVTEIPFQSTELIFCALNYLRKFYGTSSLIRVYSIINKQGEIINEIAKNNWTLNKLELGSRNIGSIHSAKATFHLNNKPDNSIDFSVDDIGELTRVWDFFSELDSFTTVNEAKLLKLYHIAKHKESCSERTLEQFKLDLEAKEEVINQYQELLKRIEEMTISKTA